MYELLVRVVDKGAERLSGHVIAAMPSPHQWGRMELANPEWRIVKADSLEIEAESLVAPGPGGSFRALRVNLDGWAGDVMSREDLAARVIEQ